VKIRTVFKAIFIVVTLFVILSVVGFYYAVTRPPTVKPHSYLIMDMVGSITEVSSVGFPMEMFFGKQLSFRDRMENLRKAGVDDRIDGVILKIGPTGIGLARAQEMRDALARFSDHGKDVVSFIEFCGDIEYYLASAADRVYMQPLSPLLVDGFVARTTFLRGTLDKLGIEPDFIQIGVYKNAPDNLIRKEMSDAHREATTSLLESVFGLYVDDIASARGVSSDHMRAVIDRGYFTSREAVREGLVDSLMYWDQVREITQYNSEYRTISGVEYSEIKPSSLGLEKGPAIALVYITGNIVSGSEGDTDEEFTTSGAMLKAFQKVREDDDIRAVVLRVNSPGGESVASDVMWREAELTREEKPVVVSMSNVAASGGYYIACASDAIVANPGTITGSIGVFAGKLNMGRLYEKLGMNPEIIKTGENAAIFYETARFTEEERQKVSEDMWDYYRNDFVRRVSDNRGLSPDSVDALGRGRVWSGTQAFDAGLVDRLGTLSDAVEIAKEKAGIEPDQGVRIVIFPKPKTFIERFLNMELESSSRTWIGKLPESFERAHKTLLMWERLSRSGGFFLLLPYDLNIE